MEKSFDLGSVLRKHQKKHKSKPMQFQSVADGVHKRLENSLKQRKSSRLTLYDCTRNLPQPSPVAETNTTNKAAHRLQQLQKWKIEKEHKRKELASKKIKPFITGLPHNPLKYVPPPPARAAPSGSGCVTRSQSARNQKEGPTKVPPQSFAPSNARFRAPQIKTLTKMPKLAPANKKNYVPKFIFQPTIPAMPAAVTTRSRAYQRVVAENRAKTSKAEEKKPTGRIAKPVSKPNAKSKMILISSSSEDESPKHTSASNSDVDLTARMISSSEDSNILSSTENDASKSLQSSSSSEFVPEKQSLDSKRRSFHTGSLKKTATPHKSTQEQDKSKLNTPRNPIPKSESSSEERLRSPKSPVDVPMTPEQMAEEFKKISPCVTMSRGKDNARKEMKKKIKEGLLEEDASDMESVEHFQRQLDSEIKRMTEKCNEWDKIYEQVTLSETVQGLVLGAVGQARLLMTKKMQQFAELVQRCACPEPGTTLVTPADLRGFWDMVFLQVENVDMRFKELEQLKARSWAEESAPAEARAPAAARAPRAARAAPRPRGGAPSRLREVIAAARKAKALEASHPGTPPQAEERTFEAGFFCVRSPARSSHSPARSQHYPARSPHSPATPREKPTLLKAVLSSEAEKASASKKSASFAMLRASLLGKNLECEGVAPLPPSPLPEINLFATPGRSILKQPQENNKSTIKQIKVVLFHHLDNEMDNTSTEDLHLSIEQAELQNTATENVDLPKEQMDTDEARDMDMDEKEHPQIETEKENVKRNSKLTRQDALTNEIAPVMTRRMQKMLDTLQSKQETPESEHKTLHSKKKTPKRSARKTVIAEEEDVQLPQTEQETAQTEQKSLHLQKKTPERSSRKTVLEEVEDMLILQMEQETPQTEQTSTPLEKKSSRRSSRKTVLAEVEDIAPQTEQETPQTEQKSLYSEKKTSRRSTRKKVLEEVVDIQTPKTDQEIPQSEQKTPKRSTRKSILTEIENNVQKENYTPMRSARRRKTEVIYKL